MKTALWIALSISAIAIVDLWGNLFAEEQRNKMLLADHAKLRAAYAALVDARRDGSCELDEGTRVVCGLKGGQLSRLLLSESDQIVTARATALPLGKKRHQRRPQ